MMITFLIFNDQWRSERGRGWKFTPMMIKFQFITDEHNLNACASFRLSHFIFTSHGHFISKCEAISSNVNIITHKMIVELSANNFAITVNQIKRTHSFMHRDGHEENCFLFLFQLPAIRELFSFYSAFRDFNIKCEMKLKCQCIKRFSNFFIFSSNR